MTLMRFPRLAIGLAAALMLAASNPAWSLPEDGFVRVPGGRIAFRVIGTANAVPVLVIHGGPGGGSCSYAATMVPLSAERPVVMYDQLGTGSSDKMLDLQRDAVLPRFVEEVTALRAKLGLKEIHLVGHSWGATVALEYLLTTKPTGVRSVSFVGPLLSTPEWIADAKALVATLPAETQAAINAAVASGKFDSPEFKAADRVFASNFGRRHPISKERQQAEFGACASSPRNFNRELYEYMWGPSEFVANGTLRDYDRSDRLKELTLPTLFLVGEFDEARPSTVRKFQALVPGSVVKVIADAGHGLPSDQTKAFNDTLSEFMAAAERRKP